MPDTLNHHALRGARECVEACVTIFPLGATELHLDEFMVVQRSFGFCDDRGRDSGVADEKHGIQGMTQTPQILALTF